MPLKIVTAITHMAQYVEQHNVPFRHDMMALGIVQYVEYNDIKSYVQA